VSALLVAHSTGTLARLLLQRQPAVGLEQLKLDKIYQHISAQYGKIIQNTS